MKPIVIFILSEKSSKFFANSLNFSFKSLSIKKRLPILATNSTTAILSLPFLYFAQILQASTSK